MKRDLFVFAGQSNMMGAAVFPPKKNISLSNSYEYKHKPRRLGKESGEFVNTAYPVGEFSYADLAAAYAPDMVNEKGQSKLPDYTVNTYFCPSMSNLKSEAEKTVYPFATFCEADAPFGATLAPFLAQQWEQRGQACAYTHIAKGGVSIIYYMTDEMCQDYARRITSYNEKHGTDINPIISKQWQMPGAAEYFFEKCKDFFEDAKKRFPEDDLQNKCFFWLQGEADGGTPPIAYETKLDIFWQRLKKIGFTHFFCIRVDYFGADCIDTVMRAQENFVAHNDDAYMLTRAASFFTYPNRDESSWFVSPPPEQYQNCRDSFFGFDNNHINEKGFYVIARQGVDNLYRVLVEKQEPVLEEELVRSLADEKER